MEKQVEKLFKHCLQKLGMSQNHGENLNNGGKN